MILDSLNLTIEQAMDVAMVGQEMIDKQHDHSFEPPCRDCLALEDQAKEMEGLYEMGWDMLLSYCMGAIHGFHLGQKAKLKLKTPAKSATANGKGFEEAG